MDDSPPVKAAFRPASFPPIEPSSSPPDRENPWNVSSAMPEFTPGPKLKDVVRADRNPRPPKRTDTDGSESSSIPKLPKNKPGCRRLATPRSLSSHTVQTPTDCTRAPDCTIARRSVNRHPTIFLAEFADSTQPIAETRLANRRVNRCRIVAGCLQTDHRRTRMGKLPLAPSPRSSRRQPPHHLLPPEEKSCTPVSGTPAALSS